MLTITVGDTDYLLEDDEVEALIHRLRTIDKPEPRLKLTARLGELDSDASAAAIVLEHALANPARAALGLGEEELRAVAHVVAVLADETMARLVKLNTWKNPRMCTLDVALRDHFGASPPP